MSKHPKPERSLLPGILKNRAFRIQGHNLTPKTLVLPNVGLLLVAVQARFRD